MRDIDLPIKSVTNKSLNFDVFLAHSDIWFGMDDFFISP